MATLAEKVATALRIGIFGAGAIGGHVAAKLAQAGGDVRLVARGETLDAIRRRGLTLRAEGRDDILVRLPAEQEPSIFGVQDVVVIAVKRPALAGVLRQAQPMIGPDTAVIFMMNGLPWWFLDGLPSTFDRDKVDKLLDETGELPSILPSAQWVACAISSGNRVLEPGVVLNESPHSNRIALGYPDGRSTTKLHDFCALARHGGFNAQIVPDIRRHIWSKLLINGAISAVSTIVERDVRKTCADPDTRQIVANGIRELLALGQRIGIDIEADPLVMTDPALLPPHITSFLQDLRAGRSLEIGNGLLAAREIGRACGMYLPHLETFAALLAARSDAQSSKTAV